MSLGAFLRETREAQGRTLEDVEEATRIRAKYLEALEADDFAALPSQTQARGFLRNYAQYLGLDPEPLLTQYNKTVNRRSLLSLAAPRARSAESGRSERPSLAHPRRFRLFSPDLFVAALVTFGLGLLVLWGGSQLAAGLVATPTLTLAPETGMPQASATLTPPPVEASPTLLLPTPLPNYTGVNILLRAEQRIWVSVKVDNREVFTGLMAPGESHEYVGESVVEVLTGNGQGTRVIWNGRDQGTLGEIGEVVVRLWTLEGMVIPTPTMTPTPSRTPIVSATPAP